ncbi:type IV pilin protein [Gilvimarinus agarilyticus]|uniref:type IV pilin protein n=1 Tax=Gilvimarinus sp. 2_MG-2023 TaxID=3062666 RepID=UPI001C0A346B|nr:type IV pilin protein [Gilvimarinus sp. 2_MG-2023]MBU2885206.1 type IV pilin protein [Gilvimarinus agarilyticus]MDO6570103.1 type IV pilin protein [Gilvimarinus sp. 2_MG-2023]
MQKNKGFTLIEMLIVVAILGIIGAIAYPSYLDSVRKSNRADAKATLNDRVQQMHRCYSRDFDFTDCSTVGTEDSAEGLYSITVAIADGGQSFEATATPKSGTPQEKDSDCQEFSINNLGEKDASPDSAGRCW